MTERCWGYGIMGSVGTTTIEPTVPMTFEHIIGTHVYMLSLRILQILMAVDADFITTGFCRGCADRRHIRNNLMTIFSIFLSFVMFISVSEVVSNRLFVAFHGNTIALLCVCRVTCDKFWLCPSSKSSLFSGSP